MIESHQPWQVVRAPPSLLSHPPPPSCFASLLASCGLLLTSRKLGGLVVAGCKGAHDGYPGCLQAVLDDGTQDLRLGAQGSAEVLK